MNVRDIIFQPQASPAVIARAKKWLVDNKPHFKGTANFAVFSEGGDEISRINRACHFSIQNAHIQDPNGRAVVATECAWDRMTKKASRDRCRPFLKWLLNDSYFAPFILNSDDVEFCLDYGFVVSADVWTPLLQNVMIVTRSFKELDIAKFRKFGELTTQGISGDLAFALCFTTNYTSMTKENHPVGHCNSGHRTTQTFTLASLLDFLHGEMHKDDKIVNDPKNHYRHNLSYMGGSSIFWEDGNVTTNGRIFIDDVLMDKTCNFREHLTAYRKKTVQESMYKAPNPFQKRDPWAPPEQVMANQISYKELWEVFVPWFLATYYTEDGVLKERKA